jgi:acetyltransferase-like isoleucine patch superfamily enzyme
MALFLGKGPATSEDPLLLIGKGFRRMWNTLVNAIFPFESAGIDLWIHYTAKLDRSTAHRIKLGNHVRLRNDVRLQVLAPQDEKGEPVIVMEDSTDIGPQSLICAKNSIHLERDVTLAQSVLIMDHNPAHENIAVPIKDQGVTEGGRIRIEKGCFIGQGAAILCDKGELVLGRNCVVAANSLVTRSFPPYCLIAGNPAKLVQQFDPEKKEWVLGGARNKEIKSAS